MYSFSVTLLPKDQVLVKERSCPYNHIKNDSDQKTVQQKQRSTGITKVCIPAAFEVAREEGKTQESTSKTSCSSRMTVVHLEGYGL